MLSVIICTYNRDKYIYNVLESLAKGTLAPDGYEIVVIENNCTDNTSSELDRFAAAWPQVNLRRFSETRQGLSFARNRGIAEARGEVLVYVDDDAFVNREYLENYRDIFERRKDISAAGGPIIPHYETGAEPRWMTYHLKRLLTGYLYFGKEERPFPGDNYPGGGNAAYRRDVFDKVGLYNVNLGRKGSESGGGEEKDIFSKMKAAGLTFVYTPGSILYHSIPSYKLENEYFDSVTKGIGSSEKKRTLAVSRKEYCKRLFKEAVKWGGTLVLCVWYVLRLKPQCAGKLLRFRANVTARLIR